MSGGFNRSSQHPGLSGIDAKNRHTGTRTFDMGQIEFARKAICLATQDSVPVLAGYGRRSLQRGVRRGPGDAPVGAIPSCVAEGPASKHPVRAGRLQRNLPKGEEQKPHWQYGMRARPRAQTSMTNATSTPPAKSRHRLKSLTPQQVVPAHGPAGSHGPADTGTPYPVMSFPAFWHE